MSIDRVDLEKMSEETAGYFNKDMVKSAFRMGTNPINEMRVADLFRGKTLPEIIEIYGQRAIVYLGPEDVAMIMYIARFFPKYFVD